MTLVGYHCSHEQHPPSRLLALARAAEAAGFLAGSCSDHIHPWTPAQGHSGFAWSWLGAAMGTTSLPFSVVNSPGQRYHPTIIAQAAATLQEMFPERLSIALGSGQYLNEHVTGGGWPAKDERDARLEECVAVIRALWAGETVTHRGLVTVEDARVYSLPCRPPRLVGAAVTAETARRVARWADALITVSRPPDELRRVVDAFREGGGEGKPMLLKVQLSFDTSDERARTGAHEQWSANVFPSSVLTDLRTPEQFEAAAGLVGPEELEPMIRISSDPERHLEWLNADHELGFGELYLHNVNLAQERFIDVFGETVLPVLART